MKLVIGYEKEVGVLSALEVCEVFEHASVVGRTAKMGAEIDGRAGMVRRDAGEVWREKLQVGRHVIAPGGMGT